MHVVVITREDITAVVAFNELTLNDKTPMDMRFEFVEEKVLVMDLDLCERISVCCDAICKCEPTKW